MENNVLICQSCGMPISEEKQKGTNEDGSLSNDYCSYCFKKGKFTKNGTLDEQIEVGLNYYPPYKNAKTQEEKDLIRKQSREFLSTLKRWKCTCTEECASGYNPICTCTSSDCYCTEKH